jgi:hemerythrin-like domain-containing protein
VDIFTRLTSDHLLTSRVLDAFERFLGEAEESGALPRVELNRFCTFFREFVELSHHDVEEAVLLPAMVQIGYSPNGAPLKHIRDEHERERRLLFELRRRSLDPAFSPKERGEVVRLGCDLIAFQRNHMKKEGELLYPALEREFAAKRLTDLNVEQTRQKASGAREAEQRWLHVLAEELIADHAPRQAAPDDVIAAPPSHVQ